MTKEKYMALADFQSLWTNSIKPYIVGGFIAMLAGTDANAKNLVLADGTNIPQSTFQTAGNYILASEKGANSGVATLGADGKVPSSQLPSYVDDVIESANFAALPATGEGGKIYITLDNNKTYRWGGTAYAEVSASIALGETEGTAYEGSKGKALKDDFDGHEADTDIHVTTSEKATWNGKQAKITASGILKGDGNGGVTAAVAGTDYQAPLTAGTDYQTPLVAGTDYQTPLVAGTDYQTPIVFNTAYNASTNKAATMSDLPEVPERVTAAELATFTV